MFKNAFTRAAICLTALCIGCPVAAESTNSAHVSIELNAVDPIEDSCRISFLIRNGYPFEIEQAIYEAVLFNTDGRVDRLTLFDFGALPAAKPRVRQFIVPGLACASLGRLLINGAETCSGKDVTRATCTQNLDLHSRTDVEIMG